MANIQHKSFGTLGREFILQHSVVQPKRLILSLVVTTTATAFFKIYEMDATVLWGISAVLLVVFILRLVNKVSKETLLVLPSLGVQVKTQYCLGHQTTQFFDRSCVKGIVINEAVTMQSVICYLAVLLSSRTTGKVEQVYPLFTHSWPRLKDLVQVYQAVQAMTPSVGTKQSASASERTDSQSWGDSDHANSFIGVKARRKHSAERAENATSTAKN